MTELWNNLLYTNFKEMVLDLRLKFLYMVILWYNVYGSLHLISSFWRTFIKILMWVLLFRILDRVSNTLVVKFYKTDSFDRGPFHNTCILTLCLLEMKSFRVKMSHNETDLSNRSFFQSNRVTPYIEEPR